MHGSAGGAFASRTTEEFGPTYLELLYENWFEIMRSARKAVFVAVLLILSFFLLDPASSATLKLGPLETGNVAAVQVLLPAITSFLLFEAIDLSITAVYYRAASMAVIRKLYPSIWKHDFELFLEPPTSFAWGGGANFNRAHQIEGKLATLLKASSLATMVFAWLGAVVFLVYAYVTLIQNGDVNWVPLGASVLFTLFNLVRATLHFAVLVEDVAPGRTDEEGSKSGD